MKLAKIPISILIIGESGTGRNSLARAIHEFSPNRERQFFAFANFGRGGKNFSDSMKSNITSFFNADIGTLYIEEIAALSLFDQLELDTYLKIQESRGSNSKTRVIAATSKDLGGLIKEDKFRSDLYFKFYVLKLPSLREREDDIMPLAEIFIREYSEKFKKEISGLNSKAVLAIRGHSWPGNISELKNCIRKAVLIADKNEIMPEDLEIFYQEEGNNVFGLNKARGKFEKEFLEQALSRNGGHVTKTADQLGVSRPTLYSMIKKYGIKI